jgi:hypothetical protein
MFCGSRPRYLASGRLYPASVKVCLAGITDFPREITAVSENLETNFLFCQRRKFWWLLRIACLGVAEPNRGQPKRQNLSLRSVLPSCPSRQPMHLPSALLQLDFPGRAHWDCILCGCRRIFGRWQMSKYSWSDANLVILSSHQNFRRWQNKKFVSRFSETAVILSEVLAPKMFMVYFWVDKFDESLNWVQS